jgi:hypothetical protein
MGVGAGSGGVAERISGLAGAMLTGGMFFAVRVGTPRKKTPAEPRMARAKTAGQ